MFKQALTDLSLEGILYSKHMEMLKRLPICSGAQGLQGESVWNRK